MTTFTSKAIAEEYEFRVAGHIERVLRFDPGPTRCGAVADGVALEHGNRGDWVISYDDLKTMYEIATAARATRKGKTK